MNTSALVDAPRRQIRRSRGITRRSGYALFYDQHGQRIVGHSVTSLAE